MRNDRIGRRRFGAAWIGAPLAMLLAVSCPYPEILGDHFDDQDSMGNGWRYGGVQWTPDGERIIVSSSYPGAYVSRSDGASVEEIGERVWIADMSPDGSRVAYSTRGKTGACGFEWWEYKIETSKLDGSARRSLRTDKESGPHRLPGLVTGRQSRSVREIQQQTWRTSLHNACGWFRRLVGVVTYSLLPTLRQAGVVAGWDKARVCCQTRVPWERISPSMGAIYLNLRGNRGLPRPEARVQVIESQEGTVDLDARDRVGASQ